MIHNDNASRLDDKLSLYKYNETLFTEMSEEELSAEIETWKVGRLYLVHILLLMELRECTVSSYKTQTRCGYSSYFGNVVKCVYAHETMLIDAYRQGKEIYNCRNLPKALFFLINSSPV